MLNYGILTMILSVAFQTKVCAFQLVVHNPSRIHHHYHHHHTQSHLCLSKETTDPLSSSLNDYSMDPNSAEAQSLLSEKLQLNDSQIVKLKQLAELVVAWNSKINLVSRKEGSSADWVFGRHVLPSAALAKLLEKHYPEISSSTNNNNNNNNRLNVIDVGTGGGFPGLPLAIIFPSMNFTLVDSVGKKLKVVEAMADELGLDNVITYNGRVEEMVNLDYNYKESFDLCLGRSVTALPRFCFWIQDLMKFDSNSKLLYIIGGELDDFVKDEIDDEMSLSALLGAATTTTTGGDDDETKYSDKRGLVFDISSIRQIAAQSGEIKKKIGAPGTRNARRERNRNQLAKGQWKKKSKKTSATAGSEGHLEENAKFKRWSSQ